MHYSNCSFCVYCKPAEVNDATFKYLHVICGAMRQAGMTDLGLTQDIDVLRKAKFVVTISCLAAARVCALHPRAKIVHWFQGIEAVERRFLHGGLNGWARWVLWSAMERVLLRRATIKLFVSQEMRRFFRDCNNSTQRSVVIPCYNAEVRNISTSQPDRYKHLNLVYAGSLYPWQCVNESLLAYKAIRHIRPDASLTIFTRETDRAREMCVKLGLPDVHVESVAPEDLPTRLEEFSFGFILREKMKINEVSTPTKFSTYLSAGVIPIITRATPAIASIACSTPFHVSVNDVADYMSIAEAVLKIVESPPLPSEVHKAYSDLFKRHFDDLSNMTLIANAVLEAENA